MTSNLPVLLSFLIQQARFSLNHYFGKETGALPAVPALIDDDEPLTRFIQQRRLNRDELVALMAGLVPHLVPSLYDDIVAEYLPQEGDFPAFGGVKGKNQRNTLPTGETVLFMLAGKDLRRRMEVQQLFGSQHYFVKEKILFLEELNPGESASSGRLILDREYVELFTLGYITPPKMGSGFPAQHITTELEWSDLVLNAHTLDQLKEVETWIAHSDQLMYDWQMYRKIKPGFRALFYGPPGTGKTMAATLLGKYTGHDVYRIDLSMMVSKYIGETEKNLAALFDKAENKQWILFFDEADSLFGKRTNVKDAHDRFANQEVSYLLQRVEEFPGVSILASNFKSNLDDAFTRRFQSIVYFPIPLAEERLILWQNSFPEAVQLSKEIDLNKIAHKYELSGSNIVNIVHYCCLRALAESANVISSNNLYSGIRRELAKENKVFTAV
ncbi:MAG: ATP-binding protein [Chitinophagales bacterium]|nr:ATP-binding protein [Chitinophagales bacterium]